MAGGHLLQDAERRNIFQKLKSVRNKLLFQALCDEFDSFEIQGPKILISSRFRTAADISWPGFIFFVSSECVSAL